MKILSSRCFRLLLVVYVGALAAGILLPPQKSTSFAAAPTFTSFPRAAVSLFENNFKVNLTVFASGVMTIGLAAVLLIAANGFILGASLRQAIVIMPAWKIFVAVAIHGIPEILCLLLSGYLAFSLVALLLNVFRENGPDASAAPEPAILLYSAGTVVALTVIAAILEAAIGVYLT